MEIILKILYIAVAFFLLLFLESFFVHLISFRIIFLVFLFAFKKLDWKQLLIMAILISIAMDVTTHYRLGTNLLMLILPLSLFSIFSLFSSVEDGVGSYIVKFLAIFTYYILNLILPSLLLSGTLGIVNGKLILVSLVSSLVSMGLLLLVDYILGGIRKRGNISQIRLK